MFWPPDLLFPRAAGKRRFALTVTLSLSTAAPWNSVCKCADDRKILPFTRRAGNWKLSSGWANG
jgi:hypothetical protein